MFKSFFMIIVNVFLGGFIFAQTLDENVIEKHSMENNFEQLSAPEKVKLKSPLERSIFNDSSEYKHKFFGYSFFNRSDTLSFFDNIPTPGSYILGPGDELIISIWGENQIRRQYTISRNGTIYDEKVGLLSPTGMKINEAEEYLKKQFSRVYATLGLNKPTSFFSLSIGSLKSINVSFVGELNNPGVYAIHPFSNLITGLIQVGGVDTSGTLRKIEIKHKNETSSTIDLYEYLNSGDLPKFIELKDQDIVKVQTRLSTVTIDSAVYRPGIYEVLENENLDNLIDYAGGLKPTASSTISIKRTPPNQPRNGPQSSKNFYVNYNVAKKTNILSGDKITVLPMFERNNYVELIGRVKKPGKYNYFESMTLKNLIELGSGFSDSTFLNSVFLNRAEIIRRDPLTDYEKVIEVDLRDVLSSGLRNPIYLQNLDKFVVHENYKFFQKNTVKILGEVLIPGSYPIVSDNEDLGSFIRRAGGFTNDALVSGIQIFRDFEASKYLKNETTVDAFEQKKKYQVAWENMKIPLMPGDSIVIKRATKTVNIVGEVFNPGIVEFKKGRGINYYINAAGGYSRSADRNGVIIIYANGIVKPKNFISNPRVTDGSTIMVIEKEPTEPFNITQFATNWTSIISSVITVVVLSKQL